MVSQPDSLLVYEALVILYSAWSQVVKGTKLNVRLCCLLTVQPAGVKMILILETLMHSKFRK